MNYLKLLEITWIFINHLNKKIFVNITGWKIQFILLLEITRKISWICFKYNTFCFNFFSKNIGEYIKIKNLSHVKYWEKIPKQYAKEPILKDQK